jgi:hypothetical protein
LQAAHPGPMSTAGPFRSTPAGAHLAFDERQRGLTPFRFTED